MARDRAARTRRQFVHGSLIVAGLVMLGGCGRLPWQAQPKIPRVGYLTGGAQVMRDAFRLELEDLGYVEGHTVAVEWRNVEGKRDRLPGVAAELVRLPVDVLVADGNAAVRASILATSAIPIIMAASASPVEDGFVASLARPGGNVTGVTVLSREMIGKRLELLKAAVPGVSRVGVLWNSGIVDRAGEFQLAEAAAGLLGLELRSLDARDPTEIDAAFERAVLERVDGLNLLDNLELLNDPARVGELARTHRLPMISGGRGFVVAGGLMSYGPNGPALARRVAATVDKILKGADPATLPVEQPTEFNLVVNLKTAQALGLTIPQSVLQQATEVIQ